MLNMQCSICKHYIAGEYLKCEAFDEIPFEILSGAHDHSNPYTGDNGIRFEPVESMNFIRMVPFVNSNGGEILTEI